MTTSSLSPPGEDVLSSTSRTDLEKEEELLRRELVVFGKDLGNVPCFRNSFLYGISGGFGTGIVTFALSSKIKTATKTGFYSYVGITLSYWIYCRYNYTMTKFKYTQLKHAMDRSARMEGTVHEMPRSKLL